MKQIATTTKPSATYRFFIYIHSFFQSRMDGTKKLIQSINDNPAL